MLVGSCIARWNYVSVLSMPVVLFQLRSRLAVCLLCELAIGMHVCMGRSAQLHIARGQVFAGFISDELTRLICYFFFCLQFTRTGTPEREKLY